MLCGKQSSLRSSRPSLLAPPHLLRGYAADDVLPLEVVELVLQPLLELPLLAELLELLDGVRGVKGRVRLLNFRKRGLGSLGPRGRGSVVEEPLASLRAPLPLLLESV